MERKGIDVSYYQGNINWELAKKQVEFAIIRCGYGGNDKNQDDKQWERNSSECERLKIPYGTYLYSYARTVDEALDEAEHVLRLVKNKSLEYPVFYDVESNDYINQVSNEQLVKQCVAFCNKIEHEGYYVGIYSSRSFLETKLNSNQLDRYDKWVAEWNPKPSYNKAFGMWQYTNNNQIEGILGRVDGDIAYLDYPQIMRDRNLNHLKESGGVTPPPVVTPDKTYVVKAGDNLTRIANMYHTTVSELVKLNNISNPNLIHPGQILKLPSGVVEPTVYIVKAGDSLTKIAKQYNVSWKAIYERNRDTIGSNPNRIYRGQRLIIP